jgi:hypothetical protein
MQGKDIVKDLMQHGGRRVWLTQEQHQEVLQGVPTKPPAVSLVVVW